MLFLSSKSKNLLFVIFSSVIVSSILFVTIGEAKKKGITGVTSPQSSGCDCHSQNPSNSVIISIQSETGSFSVRPGSTTRFTITVANPSIRVAGIDIAVKTTMNGNTNAGTLVPISGEGLQLQNGELTHSQPKNCQSGAGNYTFQWTAPSTPGQYYLRAIALAGNGNGKKDANDLWNWLTPQVITVEEVSEIDEDKDIILTPTQFNPFFYIKFAKPEEISTIRLFDLFGRLVKEINATEGELLLNLYEEQIPAGNYFLVVEGMNRIRTYNFIYIK